MSKIIKLVVYFTPGVVMGIITMLFIIFLCLPLKESLIGAVFQKLVHFIGVTCILLILTMISLFLICIALEQIRKKNNPRYFNHHLGQGDYVAKNIKNEAKK
ncbi:hypothetical protein DBR43_09930 [Pedobacter sp. KBW06]|nr:hypothetical protein DBR43_09930 [Pedobacter sp. KBW06]